MTAETEEETKPHGTQTNGEDVTEDSKPDGVDTENKCEDAPAVATDDGGGDNEEVKEDETGVTEITETEDDYKHQPLFVCCCGASFQFLGQITSHKKKSCEWIYVCPHCDRVYKDFDKMTAHKESHNTTVIPTPALLGVPLAGEKASTVPGNSDVSNDAEDKKGDKEDMTSSTDKEGSGKEQGKNGNKITTVAAAPKKKLVITPPIVRAPRPNMAMANRGNFMPNQGMMNQPFMGNFNQGMMNPQMGMGMGMMNPQMGMGMMNPQMGMGNFNMNPMMGNCMPNQGGFFPNNMGMNNMMGGPNMMGMNMGMNMGMMGGNFGPNMGGFGPHMGMNQNMNVGPNQGPMQQMGPNQGPMPQGPNQGPMSQGPNQGPMSQGPKGPMSQGPKMGPNDGVKPHHKERIGLGRDEPSRVGLGRDEPGRVGLGRDEPGRKRSVSPRRRTRSPSPASRSPPRRLDQEYGRESRDWLSYKDKNRFSRDRDDTRDRFGSYVEDRDRPSPWERSLSREEFHGSSRDAYRDTFNDDFPKPDDPFPKHDNPFPKHDNPFRNFSPRDDGPPGLAKLGFGLKRDNPDLPKHPSKMMRSEPRY